jgi:hypothetical protein
MLFTKSRSVANYNVKNHSSERHSAECCGAYLTFQYVRIIIFLDYRVFSINPIIENRIFHAALRTRDVTAKPQTRK